MGFLRWLRGGDEDTSATSVISAGLAEIDGLFRPSKHKQTEHVEESKRRRVDVANGSDIDLERGVVVVRSRTGDGPGAQATGDQAAGEHATRPAGPAVPTRPRTVFQPRRRSVWFRLVRRIRRRRRARALAGSAPGGSAPGGRGGAG